MLIQISASVTLDTGPADGESVHVVVRHAGGKHRYAVERAAPNLNALDGRAGPEVSVQDRAAIAAAI